MSISAVSHGYTADLYARSAPTRPNTQVQASISTARRQVGTSQFLDNAQDSDDEKNNSKNTMQVQGGTMATSAAHNAPRTNVTGVGAAANAETSSYGADRSYNSYGSYSSAGAFNRQGHATGQRVDLVA